MEETPVESPLVFTDGSTRTTKLSSAFVTPSLRIERMFCLSHYTSSSSAELHSILQVVIHIRKCLFKCWHIYSDSQVALSALRHAHPYGLLLATEETYFISMTTCEGHQLMFQWIPGHCGLPEMNAQMQQQH